MSCTSASASTPTQQTSPELPAETSLILASPPAGCESSTPQESATAPAPMYKVDLEPDDWPESDEDSQAAQRPFFQGPEVSRPEATPASSRPEHRDSSQTPASTGGCASSSIAQARDSLTPVAATPRSQNNSTKFVPMPPLHSPKPTGLPSKILIRTVGIWKDGYSNAKVGSDLEIDCKQFYDDASGDLKGHVGLHYEIQRRMLQARPTIFLHTPGVVVGG